LVYLVFISSFQVSSTFFLFFHNINQKLQHVILSLAVKNETKVMKDPVVERMGGAGDGGAVVSPIDGLVLTVAMP
jgi:hypothetical protein